MLTKVLKPIPSKPTPMMEQWEQCKKVAKEALLLFRMGDFYEAFYDDAKVIAKELELTLTKRQGIPMSGVPWHTNETYVERLVAKGYRVAIAEQIEDAKETKGLVKRAVTRIVTPGTIVDSTFIEEKVNNFTCALTQVGSLLAIASCDLTTGEFRVVELTNTRDFLNELTHLRPSEIITTSQFKEKHDRLLQGLGPVHLVLREPWHFDHKMASLFLTEHFALPHLDGFGLKGMVAAINGAGALLAYLKEELLLPVDHIKKITPYCLVDTLSIDRVTENNLELTQLLEVIDKTKTAMGGRLIRNWLKHPLLSVKKISQRQEGVAALLGAPGVRRDLSKCLEAVRDIERLMMKIQSAYATPRDVLALGKTLEQIAPIKALLSQIEVPIIVKASEELIDVASLAHLITNALVEAPPVRVNEGHIFRDGHSQELDELREIARRGKDWIASYQNEVREKTGIKNLKVSFNRVFGYYIEVSRGQAKRVPEEFERRQTLVNSERYISPALKEYEIKVLGAEEKIIELEINLFRKIQGEIVSYSDEIFALAKTVALLDVLLCFAAGADLNQYVCPHVNEGHIINILEGRHPVVEKRVSFESFIPNDTTLDDKKNQLMLLTGPNMAGKSTYIRQVALIVILAQMGSFVPAASAEIGVVDKIFTRIGASDDLTRGQSTFMVEMSETANILHNATNRSLVILDEIGRGTSTFDGLSIARAVAEHLLNAKNKQAKTLFATHYFELTSLEKEFQGAFNANVSVQEKNDEILFLHKIVLGGANRSYGIHVAKLAGLPSSVISRAKQILSKLENKKGKRKEKQAEQLLLFEPKESEVDREEQILAELKELSLNTVTPVEALVMLEKWKNQMRDGI